jgi:hypothetical protein
MTDKTDKRPYHSPFKRVYVTDDGGAKIKELQEEFDKFWRKVNRVADKSPEKYYAQKALQEACMWLSRGCAFKHAKPPEIIIDDELKENQKESFRPFKVSDVFGSLAGLKQGETITNNGVRIVVKPKK